MINPITGAALAEAMAGLTGQMSGLSLADAWSQQQLQDPLDAGFGVDFGVGIKNTGYNKPAISGDTEGSVIDSQQIDPVDAFNDYINQNPGGVDSTTGGAVEGSKVSTWAFSLLQTSPEVGTEVVKAVVPVAVPVAQAYTAISQALGVSMDAAQMDVETKQAFANSIVNGNNLIYDKAKGLVKAWWDGVNILFPRKTVQAVQDAIDELGIGQSATVSSPILEGSYYVGQPTVKWGGGSGAGSFLAGSPMAIAGNNGIIASTEQSININEYGYQCFPSLDPPIPFHVWGAGSQSRRGNAVTFDGKTAYYCSVYYTSNSVGVFELFPDYVGRDNNMRLAWSLIYGNVIHGGYPEGTAQSQARSYTASGIPSAGGIATSDSTTEDVVPINLPLDALDTIDSTVDPITTPTDQEEVDTLPAPPIPLPIPDTNVTNPDVPLVDPSVVDSTLVDELVEELANTLDPQAPQSSGLIPVPLLPGIPDGQGGSAYPSIVPASGSGLIHVYNPTPGEMVSFGNWLWVTYADATIDKIWNNPFDGIIGAHELYATPQTDGTDNIRSGFLVCPTTAALVRQRYTEIDCGTIIVPEFYGNYLDYSPYSQAYIYLPFIGINQVSVDDIVGHAVNIRYRIDAYTGSCIAMIYVAKQNYRNLCYQFAGNCAVTVPLAGGSQAAIKAGMIQAEAYARAGVAGAAVHGLANMGGGLATGGVLGAVGAGFSGIGSTVASMLQGNAAMQAARVANKSTVQHSGQFGESHGAMGLKKPFIMIRNPIQVKVVNYNNDYGFPAHKRVIIGGCTGYLRVREVNVISAHATNEEKIAIETALKNGVYVS